MSKQLGFLNILAIVFIGIVLIVFGYFFLARLTSNTSPKSSIATITPATSALPEGNDNDHYAIFGFIPPTTNLADKTYLFDEAQKTGKKLIRLDFPQFIIEPDEDKFTWNKIDESVRLADERGLEIEGILGWTYKWSVDTDTSHLTPSCKGDPKAINGPIAPSKFSKYLDYIKQTVQRYPQIKYWEVWNEANIKRGFCGMPEDYARLLSSAYDLIKQTNPSAKVLFSGLTGGAFTPLQGQTQSWFDSVLSFSQYDLIHKFDIFNIHIYGSDPTQMGSTISKIKQNLINKGRGDAPLWITETGYPSDTAAQTNPKYNYGEKAQADFLSLSLPLMVQSGADKVFILLRDMSLSEGECKVNPHHQFCSDGLVTFPKFNSINLNKEKSSFTVFQSL